MKYIWEPEDLIPGRIVMTNNCEDVYLISYRQGTTFSSWVLVSIEDGCLGEESSSMKDFIDDLNSQSMRPKEVILSEDEQDSFNKLKKKFE